MNNPTSLTTAARVLLVCGLLIGSPLKSDEALHWTPLADEKELRAILTDHSDLRDPFSVQFRNTVWKETKSSKDGSLMLTWCGEVNAKNAMGAYTGWSRFYAISGLQKKPSVSIATGDFARSTQAMINFLCKGTSIAEET
jgi:hypothetical protein